MVIGIFLTFCVRCSILMSFMHNPSIPSVSSSLLDVIGQGLLVKLTWRAPLTSCWVDESVYKMHNANLLQALVYFTFAALGGDPFAQMALVSVLLLWNT
jgi:hypothetical protein